jgi:hypothetical protein
MTPLPIQQADRPDGTLDGRGAGDYDQPYRFGLLPRNRKPVPVQHATGCTPPGAAWPSAGERRRVDQIERVMLEYGVRGIGSAPFLVQVALDAGELPEVRAHAIRVLRRRHYWPGPRTCVAHRSPSTWNCT